MGCCWSKTGKHWQENTITAHSGTSLMRQTDACIRRILSQSQHCHFLTTKCWFQLHNGPSMLPTQMHQHANFSLNIPTYWEISCWIVHNEHTWKTATSTIFPELAKQRQTKMFLGFLICKCAWIKALFLTLHHAVSVHQCPKAFVFGFHSNWEVFALAASEFPRESSSAQTCKNSHPRSPFHQVTKPFSGEQLWCWPSGGWSKLSLNLHPKRQPQCNIDKLETPIWEISPWQLFPFSCFDTMCTCGQQKDKTNGWQRGPNQGTSNLVWILSCFTARLWGFDADTAGAAKWCLIATAVNATHVIVC